MLMIRLQRVGRKHNPYFRVVVTDKQNSTKSGRFLEILGSYDARMGTRLIDTDRAKHWLSKGAKATATIHNMLVDKKIVTGKKVSAVRFPKKVVEAPETKPESKAETPKAEAPVQAEAPVEEVKSEEVVEAVPENA